MTTDIISYSDLTNYGSGKFTKEIDQIPYSLGGNGFCRWVGEAESTGVYTFVDVDFIELPSDLNDIVAEMDPDDLAFLRAQYGAIVFENSYGSVGVSYYEDKDSFERAVAEAEAEIDSIYEDDTFTCDRCDNVLDIEDSIKVGEEYLCPVCAEEEAE